ncbi:MAG: helix-turn-helix domain-containing protein [Prevotellaceae bacterium]|nr:helix-turn-helix domain-containing protein [Prevotellaceae bacterium]
MHREVIALKNIPTLSAKGLGPTENENYYTVPQATEKYGIGCSHLYDLIRTHKIPKITRGRNIMIHREKLDKIMSNRKI